MAEYINKDKLLNDIECIDITDCTDIDDIFVEIERTIDEQTTADVVEVVRCKECSFWDVVKTRKNVGVCTPPINDGRGGYCTRHGATYENDYCSFGRILKCPACGEKYNLYSMKDRSSCPNCGAKIDKEENL